MGSILNRGETQVIRLAMIYAFLDKVDIIEPRHIQSACAVWKYCEDSARFIFSGKEINPFVSKIRKLLKKDGRLSVSEIYQHFNKHITKDQLEESITELISRNEIVQTEIKTGGRPKKLFEFCENPTVY